MKCHFKSYCLASLSAASVLALVGCGGGGDSGNAGLVADNSPHHFVLDGQTGGRLTIRGVILPNTGWEIGSTPDEGLDPTESMLTFDIMADGSMTLYLTPSSIDPHEADQPVRTEETYMKRIDDCKWWQNVVNTQTNMLGSLEFEANDEQYGIQYRGKGICISISKVTPDETMDHESPVYQTQKEAAPDSYTYTGYTMGGTMTIQRNKLLTKEEESNGAPWFTTIELARLPAVYMAQF